MLTAIDTNVLIDVLEADPEFGERSCKTLMNASNEGGLRVCEVVWAELFTAYSAREEALREKLSLMRIEFFPATREASEIAARCWQGYRARAGDRRRIAPDFLVGGHAIAQCDRLLTRDRRFYRDYFRALNLLDPTVDSPKI